MESEGIFLVELCLDEGKDLVGQLMKFRLWMVCNVNGCY